MSPSGMTTHTSSSHVRPSSLCDLTSRCQPSRGWSAPIGQAHRCGGMVEMCFPTPRSYSSVHPTSARHPRPSSHSGRHRCIANHQRPLCCTSTARAGWKRRSAVNRTGGAVAMRTVQPGVALLDPRLTRSGDCRDRTFANPHRPPTMKAWRLTPRRPPTPTRPNESGRQLAGAEPCGSRCRSTRLRTGQPSRSPGRRWSEVHAATPATSTPASSRRTDSTDTRLQRDQYVRFAVYLSPNQRQAGSTGQ